MSKRPTGEGSVYERSDGKWIAEITRWENGKRLRRKRVCRLQREALEALKELRTEATGPVASERMTVAVWLREWLEKEAARTVRPRTLTDYTMIVNRHLIPAIGHHRLRKLNPRQIRDYMEAKRQSGLSPRSVELHHAVLRRALRVAEGYEMVPRNVARLVSPPPVKARQFQPLTPEQVQTLLGSIRGTRHESLYVTAIATGLRMSELLGLQWGDIDMDVVHVRRTLQRYQGEYHLDPPKTERSRRSIPIPPPVVGLLREHRNRQLEEKVRNRPIWEGDSWQLVFATETGGPLNGTVVTHCFHQALKTAGLPRVRFHDLRHGAATYLLGAGVDIRTVMELLGHSDIATTANIYSHVLPSLKRDATARLSAVLFEPVATSMAT